MRRRISLASLFGAAILTLTVLAQPANATQEQQPKQLSDVIPVPVSAKPDHRADFQLTPATVITADRGSRQVADYLRGVLRPSTGYSLPVVPVAHSSAISLQVAKTAKVGDQGYQLDVTKRGVTIRANTTDGLFAGVQTLRQLLPAKIEAKSPQRGVRWTVPGGSITDYPRFAQRSASLDVARHFFNPDQVKTYIDQIAQYKINTLHLHLADDQGWRIEIKSWPNLTAYGSTTQVGGGPGGYYTQEQYKDLVAYAASRHITVVPELDMPGHTNAALASYPELNCDGIAPPLYTGIDVGFSSYCVNKDITYEFLDDVIGELAAMTPGKYLHIGGDEAHSTTDEDYQTFESRLLPIVAKYGKFVEGWHEIASVDLPKTAIPQFWDTDGADDATAAAAARGNKILMSPANKAYVDQMYTPDSPLGLHWAGYVEVRDAYDWDPSTTVAGVSENQVAGVEAALWSETITDNDDIEYLAFPRLPGIAEIGWSPKATHDWNTYRVRLANQAPRWDIEGINFYRSPQVDWK